MVDGSPMLRTPEGERELRPGEVVAFPLGEAGAHQVINRSARAGANPDRQRDERAGHCDSPGVREAQRVRAPARLVRRRDARRLLPPGRGGILGRRGTAPGAGALLGVRVERIGVAGAGTMGAGIAQVAALGGYETRLHDPVAEALERGWRRLREQLAQGAKRGRWSEADAEAAAGARRARGGARGSRGLRARDRGLPGGPGAEARAVRSASRRSAARRPCSRPTPPRCR